MNELCEIFLINNFNIANTGEYFTFPAIRSIYNQKIYNYFYEQEKFQIMLHNKHEIIRYFHSFKEYIYFDFYLSDDNEINFIDLPTNYNIDTFSEVPNNIKNGFILITKDINIHLPLLNIMKILGNT